MEGGFALKPREEKSPFRTDIRFEKIDLNRLITEAGGPPDQAGGNFAGSLNLAGNAGNPGSISGAGRIDLFNGEIAQYQLLQELGKLLRIEELTRPRLDQAFAAFHVHEGQVLIDQLLLQSTNLRITAHGSIGFDGRIDLDAHLLINAKISAQLPDFIRDSFSPDATPGARFLDFKVGGKIDKPTTSLSDFLGNVGKQLEKKVGKWGVDLLRNILGSKKLNGDDSPATQAPAPPNPPNPK